MISQKHCISAIIECNVIDAIYVGKLEIQVVLTCHYPTCSVWPGPLLIALNLALNAESLDNPVLDLDGFGVFMARKDQAMNVDSIQGWRQPSQFGGTLGAMP